MSGLKFAWHYLWYVRWRARRRHHWLEMITAECQEANHKEAAARAAGITDEQFTAIVQAEAGHR